MYRTPIVDRDEFRRPSRPGWDAGPVLETTGQVLFERLAIYGNNPTDVAALAAAATHVGVTVLELPLDVSALEVEPAADMAWRCPPGFAVEMRRRGIPLPVTGAPARWFAALPVEVTGRRLQVRTVAQLVAGEVDLEHVRMVKLAQLKHRPFPATRVSDLQHAQQVVVDLPPESELLLADRWLPCHSEYRVFSAGERAMTCSPYRIDDEIFSRELWMHHASFHEQALAFTAGVLAGLHPHDRPPGCVLDVARLDDGRLVLLEVNTSWGAGLYGCDPDAALISILAANRPADSRWDWP